MVHGMPRYFNPDRKGSNSGTIFHYLLKKDYNIKSSMSRSREVTRIISTRSITERIISNMPQDVGRVERLLLILLEIFQIPEPYKRSCAKLISKPLFLCAIILVAFGALFTVLPGLRPHVWPFTEARESKAVEISAVSTPTTTPDLVNSGNYIGTNYGNATQIIDNNPYPETTTYKVLRPSFWSDRHYVTPQIQVSVTNSPTSGTVVWDTATIIDCSGTSSPPLVGRGGKIYTTSEPSWGTFRFGGVSLTSGVVYFQCTSTQPIVDGMIKLFAFRHDNYHQMVF